MKHVKRITVGQPVQAFLVQPTLLQTGIYNLLQKIVPPLIQIFAPDKEV